MAINCYHDDDLANMDTSADAYVMIGSIRQLTLIVDDVADIWKFHILFLTKCAWMSQETCIQAYMVCMFY